MRALVAGVWIAVIGCSSDARPGSGPSQDEPRAASSTKSTEPASAEAANAAPQGPRGVAPIASAPRRDWPCAKTVDSVGARITYDYTNSPEACWFPPDLWQPGCPTRHEQANPALGVAVEVRYRYDAQQRLVAIASDLSLARIDEIRYEGDEVVSQDGVSYYPAEGAVHLFHDDGTYYAAVEPGETVGIRRLRTGGTSPADEDPTTDEQFEYEGTRLMRIKTSALGILETHEFEYDCR